MDQFREVTVKLIRKFLVLSALFMGFAGTAQAQVSCSSTQCTGPASEVMTSIFPRPSGGVLIDSAQTVAAVGCTGSSGGTNVLLEGSHTNYKETYAALLTALASDARIQLRVDTAQASCTLFFARILSN